MCQNQKLQFYSREKCFIEDHIVQIIERVVSCFENRYGSLYSNLEETSINIPSDDGDHIILDVCRILNCNVWPRILESLAGCRTMIIFAVFCKIGALERNAY